MPTPPLHGLKASELINNDLAKNIFRPVDRQKFDTIEPGAQVNPPTTRDRTSTSTAKVLQAAALRDHTLSSDHDERYYTKDEIEDRHRVRQVDIDGFTLRFGADVTYTINLPGARPNDTVIVTPPNGVLRKGISVGGFVETADAVRFTLHNNNYNFFSGQTDIPAGVWTFTVLRLNPVNEE